MPGEPGKHLESDQPDSRNRRHEIPTSGRTTAQARAQPLGARCEAERQRQDHERCRTWRRPQGQAGGALRGEPLEDSAVRRGVVERRRSCADREADEQQRGSAGASDERAQEPEYADRRDDEAEADHHRVVDVGQRWAHPRVEPVTAVEEPVAEPPDQFGRCARTGDGLVGLGVAQDRHTEVALDAQGDNPPQRHRGAQDADSQGPTGSRSETNASAGDVRDEPDDRADPGEHQGRCVDAADERDDQRELGGRPP